jgi:hypothetical protein
MSVKQTKGPLNIPTSSIEGPPKFPQIAIFWSENIPSGNPALIPFFLLLLKVLRRGPPDAKMIYRKRLPENYILSSFFWPRLFAINLFLPPNFFAFVSFWMFCFVSK